jgi:hypothetical protein
MTDNNGHKKNSIPKNFDWAMKWFVNETAAMKAAAMK